MGSEASLKLPVIDFSKLGLQDNKSSKWESVRSQVHKALQDYGCFEAMFDDIPIDIRKTVFLALQDLFNLPLQTKLLNVSNKPYHGYVGQYPMVPLYESMGFVDANIAEKVETLTSKMWPEGNPFFSKTIQSFSEQVSELDQIIRKMVLQSLGLEGYMDEHMNSTNYLLRVQKYTGPETSETKLGLHSHTDKNIVTILYQNHVEGFQVQTKDKQWIHIKPSSDSFIVMIGDSLMAWTNGRLYSPRHRVMMTGNEARYSAGLFSIPKGGYIIKAPEEMVDEKHPLLFKPFDHFEFLKFVYTPDGQKAESALREYCGV